MSSLLRAPAVAGTFYVDDPAALRRAVDRLLAAATAAAPRNVGLPKALIAPHAGYLYSGSVAARAFQRLAGAGGQITRVVVIGPSHHVAFRGIAAPSAAAFRTPLGDVVVDRDALDGLAGVVVADAPHAREHAIEVELPFLQRLLPGGGFALVPLVVGEATDGEVAGALEPFVEDPKALVVVSSDLSHFLDHATAVRRDSATAAAIERLEGAALGPEDACGFRPIRGWLALARRHGLAVERLDLKTSGDTAGNRDRVVGYGAWAFARPHGGRRG
jgi:AmmeMemoRadiSam system protein B